MGELARVQCPRCGDEHDVTERDQDRGKRRCPECGEPTAFAISERRDEP